MSDFDEQDLEYMSTVTQQVYDILGVTPLGLLMKWETPEESRYEVLDSRIPEWIEIFKNTHPIVYLGLLRTTCRYKEKLSNWNILRDLTTAKFSETKTPEEMKKIMRGLI